MKRCCTMVRGTAQELPASKMDLFLIHPMPSPGLRRSRGRLQDVTGSRAIWEGKHVRPDGKLKPPSPCDPGEHESITRAGTQH